MVATLGKLVLASLQQASTARKKKVYPKELFSPSYSAAFIKPNRHLKRRGKVCGEKFFSSWDRKSAALSLSLSSSGLEAFNCGRGLGKRPTSISGEKSIELRTRVIIREAGARALLNRVASHNAKFFRVMFLSNFLSCTYFFIVS
jgi:hypothetical protein